MGRFAHCAELHRARLGAARRHVGLLIPPQDRSGHAQVNDLSQPGSEYVEFCAHGELVLLLWLLAAGSQGITLGGCMTLRASLRCVLVMRNRL